MDFVIIALCVCVGAVIGMFIALALSQRDDKFK